MSVQFARATRTVQIAVTRTGAVYAYCSGALLRFKGYRVDAYTLESGLAPFEVGGHLNALVLPESGVGVGRVTSTRFTEVFHAETDYLGHLPTQFAQIARAVAALDLVGQV